jgi:hypothetical protein
MALLSLREAVASFTVAHVAFTALGGGASAVATAAPPPPVTSMDASTLRDVALVQKMYSGHGLDPRECAPDVTFSDPIVCCEGRHSAVEAFRALRYCRPQQVTPPSAAPSADGADTVIHLHQRYFGSAWFKGLEVRSTLVLRRCPDGQIGSLEERWNGAPLLQFAAFRWVRRINGVISTMLTPLLLR